MLSCAGTLLKVDLPASLKDRSVPDMTLAAHPDDFYTIIHAKEVLERMKVRAFVPMHKDIVTCLLVAWETSHSAVPTL